MSLRSTLLPFSVVAHSIWKVCCRAGGFINPIPLPLCPQLSPVATIRGCHSMSEPAASETSPSMPDAVTNKRLTPNIPPIDDRLALHNRRRPALHPRHIPVINQRDQRLFSIVSQVWTHYESSILTGAGTTFPPADSHCTRLCGFHHQVQANPRHQPRVTDARGQGLHYGEAHPPRDSYTPRSTVFSTISPASLTFLRAGHLPPASDELSQSRSAK